MARCWHDPARRPPAALPEGGAARYDPLCLKALHRLTPFEPSTSLNGRNIRHASPGQSGNLNSAREDTMKHAIKLTLMAGVAAGALAMISPDRGYAQAVDPNGAPNPYKMEDNWAKLEAGRKFGAAIKVQVDHSDGKSIWVFDRCGAAECTNSLVPPIQKFDSSGKFVRAFGGGIFAVPHSLYVDKDGNVWAGDQIARNGKGSDLIKFSPDGRVLMTLGKPGMPGNDQDHLTAVSAVVVAPNGDIYVNDGHGQGTNDRIVKYSKDGKFVTAWSKHGKAAGEVDTPHGIALDSAGRVYVADRVNNRIQIYEPDGKFIAEWKQFGRPSDVAIDKNDVMYVADSQSDEKTNPGFKQGIRIGSVKDGKVTAFIRDPSGEEQPEGVGVDDAGNVYGGWTGKMAVKRFVKN
jgi:sugar lactone lactonase YvrE